MWRLFIFLLALFFAQAVPIIGWLVFAIVCFSLAASLGSDNSEL